MSSSGTAATTTCRFTSRTCSSRWLIRIAPGHEVSYYPGENNLLMADVIVINKIDSASPENIEIMRQNIRKYNPTATVIDAASPITVSKPELIKGQRVLVVEDGPTLTHGEMTYGAGVVAAQKFGAAELVDPRPYTVESITATYRKYPKIGTLLPAMGYGDKQVKDLETTINRTKCDLVLIATPIDLSRAGEDQQTDRSRVSYSLQEIGEPNLEMVLTKLVGKKKKTVKRGKKR